MAHRITSDDFFDLFVKREGKVVLGRNLSTLWLLTAVLAVTFLAIAFSNASMNYLSDKMNDPFIRWMDIPNRGEGEFHGLENALGDYENMERFDYDSFQADYYRAFMFFGKDEHTIQYFRCRFFEDLQIDLMAAIVSEENVVDNNCIEDVFSLPVENIGVILTKDALTRLGYETAPPYIYYQGFSEGADSLGIKTTDDGFARVPLPVLAVVRRLPSDVDIVSSRFFLEQEDNDNTYPFNLAANRYYSESLHYFVPSTVDYETFGKDLEETGRSLSTRHVFLDEVSFWKPEILSFYSGDFVSLTGSSEPLLPLEVADINDSIMEKWGDKGVCRVYDFNFTPYSIPEKSYLSVYFNSLNNIREFESFVNDTFHIKLDMSQVNSKENFHSVSILAGVLSWAIIVFAIVCIVLFIVNLLQSYFQKVKRNIGTFKAFGVSNRRLTTVYVLIVGATIVAAILIALLITLVIQGGLNLMGIMKEGSYGYLSLWSLKTVISILIIIVVSVTTVHAVMNRLLHQTPGDLIYDRQ